MNELGMFLDNAAKFQECWAKLLQLSHESVREPVQRGLKPATLLK